MWMTIVFDFYGIMTLKLSTGNDNSIHGIIVFKWLHTAYVDLALHGRIQLLHSVIVECLYGTHRRLRAVNTDRRLHPIEYIYRVEATRLHALIARDNTPDISRQQSLATRGVTALVGVTKP